jgi:tetratricopeptide (TPR) repeat protein
VTNSYLKLGEAPFNAGNFAEAAEIYARAHEAIPANADIANRLAEAYGKMQEYEKAYAIFDELIAAEGPTADAAKSRLGFYMMLNANELKDSKPSEAVDILSRAIAVDGNPQAYMLLLQVANGSKNYDKIIEVGESAAEAQSDAAVKSTAYSLLGMAYQQKGDKAKAIEALRKVTSGPNAPAAKATITALQAEMGN